MTLLRLALANLRFPASPAEAVEMAVSAIEEAALAGAAVLCFPECFVPGYRAPNRSIPTPDSAFLKAAWSTIAKAAGGASVTVILGTERSVDDKLHASALVISRVGTIQGFQDKVQVDLSEDDLYAPGSQRCLFHADALRFGVVICHEGWRYPETVRWAAQRGAQVVFHPQFHEREFDGYVPTSFADPRNSFHEKAALCRAAENNCYFATVNYASAGSPTTSAIIGPDGTLLAYQPYGVAGLLIADIDLRLATGLLAKRCKTTIEYR